MKWRFLCISQVWLLDITPPTRQGRKTTFSLGNTIYVWVESRTLNKPQNLQIVWVAPDRKEIKRETFALRGWGTKAAAWSGFQTNPQTTPGTWQIKLLIDGQLDRAIPLSLIP